ncbi:Aste57867_5221 [Aphanomyces stellatus]|uniref:Phosphorylated adapter RNA export protein n=1 Tax=Aphanomyces stellatus TaxID=120398 RepID=A0A485KDZ2_9STRA|nr:hypothetical protein As57867_005208 [Aphanomyces stellatus]VFT82294.1 Aste57867_5221 [Aphanomyces stellatus]
MPQPSAQQRQKQQHASQRKPNHAQRVGREMAHVLGERKIQLVVRVVQLIGERLARSVLAETLAMHKKGATLKTVAGRPRTLGGAFFTLLKERVTKETYKDIYAIEEQKKKEQKKSKVRAERIKTENALMGGFSLHMHLDEPKEDGEEACDEHREVAECNPRFQERDWSDAEVDANMDDEEA